MPASTRTPCEGLARINRLSRSDAILWPAIERLARTSRGLADPRPRRGERRRRRADRPGETGLASGLAVEIEGCDVSPEAVRYARQRAEESGLALRFFELDVLNEPIPAGYDVVTCSLFLHHLDEADACAFLRKAADATSRLLLVNDLVRGPVGYLLAWSGLPRF